MKLSLQQIEANLPDNMHPVDKWQYMETQRRIAEIEASGYNTDQLEPLRNYAFRIITPYITITYADFIKSVGCNDNKEGIALYQNFICYAAPNCDPSEKFSLWLKYKLPIEFA